MRIIGSIVLLIVLVCDSAACRRQSESEAEKDKREHTAGEQAGKAAYWTAKQAGALAEKAGKQLEKTAQQAHKGWTEAAREDRDKHKTDKDGK